MEDIVSKIKKFFTNNEESKRLQKILDPLNKEIKDALRNQVGMSMIVDDIEATITIQSRSKTNDLKMLAKLRKLNREDLITTIEVPDHAKIEKLIYDQELDAELLSDCLDVQNIEILKVRRVKTDKTIKNKRKKEN